MQKYKICFGNGKSYVAEDISLPILYKLAGEEKTFIKSIEIIK